MKGIERIKADGKKVIYTLKEPNADLPYLLSDYHPMVQPNGGKDGADAGIGAGPYKVSVNEPGIRQAVNVSPTTGSPTRWACRSGRNHCHQ